MCIDEKSPVVLAVMEILHDLAPRMATHLGVNGARYKRATSLCHVDHTRRLTELIREPDTNSSASDDADTQVSSSKIFTLQLLASTTMLVPERTIDSLVSDNKSAQEVVESQASRKTTNQR